MNIIDQFTNAWKVFCRPPRQTYSVFDLGPPLFQTKLYKCKRHEFKVKNSRGHTLECSFYEPVGIQNPECIIYLHCFNGSRIESIKFAEPSISRGCAFCCFDFSGSGLSEGEYVSLGYYEQDDVQVVVNHLRSQFNVKSIALWGRSMGAVTALLYTQKYPTEVQALAIDSAFVSMWDAGVEIADKKVSLPTFIIKGLLEYVRRQIKQNAGYDMEDVNTIKDIQKCLMPVLFIVSKEDKLVSFENSQKLFEKYPANAKKNILYVKGDHNECRSWEDVLKIADFLSGSIKTESKSDIPQNKENFHLIQAEQSNYNTPNNREEQKQQNVIKLIHYQQQQANAKQSDQSPPNNIQLHNSSNQRSPSGSISSESPANQLYRMPQSHTHSYHTSQIVQQNQTITHHYILHNQQNPQPHHHSQHQSLSRPTSQLSNQKEHFNFSNSQQSVQAKKPLHQHSTSNITADHYKQLGTVGAVSEEKNQPIIDQNDIDNNPLVQQLLKDLIQKNYASDFKAPNEISQLPYQNSPLNQAQQFQQQPDQKNVNFTQKMNELEYKQQFVLNKGIQNLQSQLQVQQSLTSSQINLNSNSQINSNQISNQTQNFMSIPLPDPQQNIGSRKSSVVSPTNMDMKTSNIPDEMHEIDFPKAKDFRTKQKINNYTFQLHPPMNTFSSSTVATTKDYNIQQSTPQNESTQRKQSILLENNYSNQILQLSQINPAQQYVPKLNHNSAFSTLNNSPQFFNDKTSVSPRKQLQNLPTTNKNLSQIQGEDSINVPNQNTYPQNNFISTQPQQQFLVQQQQSQQLQQQQQQLQLNQGNNLLQNPHQKKWSQNNENSIQKANVQNTQEEEDFHNLPQSTLTINLKQKKRQSIDYSVSVNLPQTERQNTSDAEQRKQQFDIQQRKSTLDNLLQKPLGNQQKTISSNNIIDVPSELEGSMMLNSGMRAEQRSTVSNNIKQKCMNNSTHQSASIVKVNHSQHQDSSYVIQNLQQSQQAFQNLFSSNIQQQQINMSQIQNQDIQQGQNDQQQMQQFFMQQQQLKQQILPLILQQQEEIKQQQLKQQQEKIQQESQKNQQNQQDEASFGKQGRIPGLSQEKFRNDKSNEQQSRQGKFVDKSQFDRNKSKEMSQDQKHKEKYKNELQQLQRAEEQITQLQQNNYFINVGSKQQYQNESKQSSFQQQETFSYLQQDQNKTGSNSNSQNNSIFQPSTNTTKDQRFIQDLSSQIFQQPQISGAATNSPLNRFQPFSSKSHQSKNSSHVFRYKLDIENILNKNQSQKSQLNNSFLNQQSLSKERDSKNQQNYSSNQLNNYHQQSLDFQNQNQQKEKQQNDKKELIRYDSLNDEPNSQKTRLNTSQISHGNNSISALNGNSSFQQTTPNQNSIPFSQLPKSSQKVIEQQQQFIQQKMQNQQNRQGQSPSMNYSRGLNQIATPSNQKQGNQVNNSSASSFKQNGHKNQNDSLEMNRQQIQQSQIQNRLTKEQSETFNSKYQQYVNGLSLNTYGKILTPTNLFSSKQESKQQQNNNSQQQLTNHQNIQQIQLNSNLTHSVSNTKMYVPNPSDHSKHKILQKSLKDKKPIEGQSSTKGSYQQQLDFNQKATNPNSAIVHSLSQEDYAKLKKKQDMMSYIQKNRNIAMNIDPQQGQNANSQTDESFNKNQFQNIQNPNHKNRFINNNNLDSQDQFSSRQIEPLQSSQSPLSRQLGKYSGNQNFDGNISKKASQASSSTNAAGFFQYKNNNSSSTLNAIEQYQNSKINNPSSLSPNQRLVTYSASSTTSQKFAFKNRVNQATKVVQIQLGDKRQGDQCSFEGHNSSINNSNIMQYQQPSRSSQSPNHRLFQKQ
ncbi:abnormal long morphology protein, putative (macronuclear) [Tetrahymena thermophila SB210]|uniref:Abnormal long morphology protein, putative n=1 Tax=Tetrahymena thermophila (strain SB210) TaxID=312017 RepID=A4VCR7_TETTS|nr:abnormal long morphology protein, putative [Tetrahymena thermophila SB210]EDK31323.1 abnormal long morphology protein, putative [Tetrahymena thermophila SB210]|eukprot:XP_001471058.1 abnormal long morphology protein, putative [Tetrahymena thermophila SB210]